MPYNIPARLAQLRKTRRDLWRELANRNLTVTYEYFTRLLSGEAATKTMDTLLSAANEIVAEWERSKANENTRH